MNMVRRVSSRNWISLYDIDQHKGGQKTPILHISSTFVIAAYTIGPGRTA
jgi:hypothetical protein